MKQHSIVDEKTDALIFVIQKHAATRLHYDFRLQIGKVMPSWAIPKGPTLDPNFKRLAMQTPDHDLEYRNFEGVIEVGSYGAGTVMIWDKGFYIPEKEVAKGKLEQVTEIKEGQKLMKEGLEKGQLKFQLFGSRLKGSFALVRTRGFGSKPSWLLIKHKDRYIKEGYDPNEYDFSAISNKTLAEIKNSK